MISRLRPIYSIAVCALGLLIACSTSKSPSTSRETNWLNQCKVQADCDDRLSCICGVCTKLCNIDENCNDLSDDAVCVEAESLQFTKACQPSDSKNRSICDVYCSRDADCQTLGKGFFCQDGFCRIKEQPEPDGSVDSDAATSDASDDDISTEPTREFQLPELDIFVPDRRIPVDVEYLEYSGALPSDVRAPRPGEVQANIYGGPGVPFSNLNDPDLSQPEAYGASWPMEHDGEEGCNYGPRRLVDPDLCHVYYICTRECERDSDCEDGGSGDAVPRCDEQNYCELECDESRRCPDGMVCIGLDQVYTCLWPYEIAKPGCPAWCDLEPLRKGCPGWCAVAGVGCDPQEQGYCCDSLVCSEDGWCVQQE